MCLLIKFFKMDRNTPSINDPFLEDFDPQSLGHLLVNQDANYHLTANSKFLVYFCSTEAECNFKSHFYQLTADYFEDALIALGGQLKSYPLQERAALLLNLAYVKKKTLLIIGADLDLIYEIQLQQHKLHEPFSLTCISDHSEFLGTLDSMSLYLKEINFLAFQRQHLASNHEKINYYRTGEFRSSASSFEPPLRRSEYIYFDLNAIRASDCPGNRIKNPSGLFSEEASTISRMAGMSDRVKMYFISSWNESNDPDGITARLVAQMSWYFLEGCHLKQLDQNMSRESLTQYLVEIKNLDYIVKFYKSENTGKWWFEEPLVDNEFSNQLIPCTYEEYLATAKDQIPSRILELINN